MFLIDLEARFLRVFVILVGGCEYPSWDYEVAADSFILKEKDMTLNLLVYHLVMM